MFLVEEMEKTVGKNVVVLKSSLDDNFYKGKLHIYLLYHKVLSAWYIAWHLVDTQ